MSFEHQAVQKMKSRLSRLGKPKWKDPERRQSIKDNNRAKMEWQIRSSLWTMTCWAALPPAKYCLSDVVSQIEALVSERSCDIWDGERTSRGCTWDRSMYGHSIQDAQPTIIFSSSSKMCLRNAKRIIHEENIQVDPRGIGIEYYENGPVLFQAFGSTDSLDLKAGLTSISSPNGSSPNEKTSNVGGKLPAYLNEDHESSPNRVPKPAINAALASIGQVSCTIGGIILVNGELYGLTVAHAFEREVETDSENQVAHIESSPPTIHYRTSGTIGHLHGKRQWRSDSEPSSGDLDWALCTIDRTRMHLSNTVSLANGNILCPRNIAQTDPIDMAVVVHTGLTGVVNGCILGDYSLVALPGSKYFQRMWIVILDRLVQKGDCGSWVLDPTNGDWLGHIVAGKLETSVAYIVLAREIASDISNRFGDQTVRMPCPAELEDTETVSDIKRALQLPEPQQAPALTSGVSISSISSKSIIPSKRYNTNSFLKFLPRLMET
ncbi:hypothetical protein N431DRAFT_353051 [Stipitochalara longipes BDJ]|nr:hypothetical protein N431DRAFT_353051 [Stipitochalara longipes BDJ]